jgi:hypothetical protein
MRRAAGPYLFSGEPVQAVIGARTARSWPLPVRPAGHRYRIIVVTPVRILILGGGSLSRRTASGVLRELPRSTVLGPGGGCWHRIAAGNETLRVHARFFRDLHLADCTAPRRGGVASWPATRPASWS